ncbi:vitellogenin-2 [Cloeon dipterum]|uniref:vitellogenin-2 n=1 Tax=Cloeon dipterum TaxID=197152 RepID=UPI003220247B
MRLLAVLFAASAFAAAGYAQIPSRVFPADSELLYSYLGHISAGTTEPQEFLSHFSINGKLRVQTLVEKAIFKLEDVSISAFNGEGNKHKLPKGEWTSTPAPSDANAISVPFVALYDSGKITTLEYETTDTVWSKNLKRAIASQFQIELNQFSSDLPKEFISDELGISGECKVENIFTQGEETGTILLRKSQDATRCKGKKFLYDNLSRTKCKSDAKSPISTSTERTYVLHVKDAGVEIKKIRSRSVTSFQPLWIKGELQYIFVNQTIEEKSAGPISNPIEVGDTTPSTLAFEFQESISGSGPDLTFERHTMTSDMLVKLAEKSLVKTADHLNKDPEENVDSLHDKSPFHLLAFMQHLDYDGLKKLKDFAMLGTSYKDDSIKQLFVSYLSKVGTRASVLLIRDLVLGHELDDKQTMKLLIDLPFHLRFPNATLLKEFNEFLNLDANLFENHEIRKTAILTFASMVGKVCQSGVCPPAILDEYVKILYDRLRDATDYGDQMMYVQAMGNVRIGPVTSYLEPIITGKLNFSRQLRYLAIWAASDELIDGNPEKVREIFWPILANRQNELELRSAALTMLLRSEPTTQRFMNILWFMVSDPSHQLYKFFYTTLFSFSNTKFPCYSKLAAAAQQIQRMAPKPQHHASALTTSNEIIDFVDPDYEIGHMYQLTLIGSERSDNADITYLHADMHVQGQVYNSYSIFLRTEGSSEIAANKIFNTDQSGETDIAKALQALFDKIKVRRRKADPPHIEIIIKVQGRTILSVYMNETDIGRFASVFDKLRTSTPLSQHINYQTLEQAAFFESIFPSDIGTAILIGTTTLPLMDIKGNLTYNFKPPVVAVNVSLDTRFYVRRGFGLRVFNPISALWHGVHRPSVQILSMPLDFGISFDVAQKTFKARLGWTKGRHLFDWISHGRTSVYAAGSASHLKDSLSISCPNCTYFTKVRDLDKLDENKQIESNLFDSGIDARFSSFDCDKRPNDAAPFVKSLFLQRFSNYGFPDEWGNYLTVIALRWEMLAAVQPLLKSCGHRFSLTPSTDSSGVQLVFKTESVKEHKRLYRILLSIIGNSNQPERSWDANLITEGNEQETRLGVMLKIVARSPNREAKEEDPSDDGSRVMKMLRRFENKQNSESTFVTCIKAENTYPERGPETYWDQLGQPFESRQTKHHMAVEFHYSDDGKCPMGKEVPRFEITATTDHQGLQDDIWPFSTCLEQRQKQQYRDSKGNLLFPATFACATCSWAPRPRNVSMTFTARNIPHLDALGESQLGKFITKEGNDYSIGVDMVHALDGESVAFQIRASELEPLKVPLLVKGAPYIISENLANYPSVDNLKMAMDLIHPCLVAGGKVLTFDNSSLPFEPQPDFTLISAVCTANSPFALFAKKTEGADALTLRVFVGEIEINVVPSDGKKSIVTYNEGVQAKDLKALGITVTQKEKGKVDIRYEDFYVRNTDINLGLLVPEEYEKYYCGVCGDSNKVPEYTQAPGPQGNKIPVEQIVNAYTIRN